MRILVCGGREFRGMALIRDVLERVDINSIIIQGGCRGADEDARLVANQMGITTMTFPARWALYGRPAGPIRNRKMLEEGKPDIVYAFHDDLASSRGTKDMVDIALKAGIPVLHFSQENRNGKRLK